MTKTHFQVTGYGQASGMHHLTVLNNKQYICAIANSIIPVTSKRLCYPVNRCNVMSLNHNAFRYYYYLSLSTLMMLLNVERMTYSN